MEGFPGSIIMIMLAIMYKNFGVSNADITLYTGALVLPWVLKPLWASLIDVVMTPRRWIYSMEILIGMLLIAMAMSLSSSYFFIFTLVIAWLIAFLSSSHDIAADGFYISSLAPEQQSFFVGLQSAAYNVGKISATGFIVMLCGVLYYQSNSYFFSWHICLLICGAVSILFGMYHKVVLPKAEFKRSTSVKQAVSNFVDVYKSFFQIDNLWVGLLFILFFKFSESMVGAILPLFLVGSIEHGGLGLSNTFTGFAYGTVAPLAIILGGILGGYCLYRKGFASMIYILYIVINLPHIFYILLAVFHVDNHILVLLSIAIEQFSFSVGLSAYILFTYFMVKDSKYKTAHYAFFTGAVLLAKMIPVMISGLLQEYVGYAWFFTIVLVVAIPVIPILKRVKKVAGDYGKTKDQKLDISGDK